MNISKKKISYIKLTVIFILLLWLFLKSPFNPLYSDYSTSEFYFIQLNFIFWSFFTFFMIGVVNFINLKNYEDFLFPVLIIIYGFNLTFYIFYGLDVTDTGFSLSKQWAMYHGMWKENFDAIAGTNLIGGLWLLIPGKPLLIWARIGFVILQTLIFFMSCKILLLYFKPKQIFLPVLSLSLFLSIWHFYMTINYDNLPFLIFLIAFYLILKDLFNEKFTKMNYIYSGVISLLAVFCKISYILAFFLPVLLIILDGRRSGKKDAAKKVLNYFYGIIIGTVIIVMFLFFTDGLNSYVTYFMNILKELVSYKEPNRFYSNDHSFIGLYNSYKKDFISSIAKLVQCFFIISVVEFLKTKLKSVEPLRWIVILSGAFGLYYTVFEFDMLNKLWSNDLKNLLSLFSALYILWALSSENSEIKKYNILILASIALFFLSFAGSDLSIRAAFHVGGGFILFSTIAILIKEVEFKIWDSKYNFNFIYYFIVVFFLINSIYKKDNLYRETQFSYLNTVFSSTALAGIKTIPEKAAVVDSLLIYLKNIENIKFKKILFTRSNALMYYLSGNNYILSSPWDILEEPDNLIRILNEKQPNIIVESKGSHRSKSWPLINKSDSAEPSLKKRYEYYEKFIRHNNYKVVYTNSFYIVYSL